MTGYLEEVGKKLGSAVKSYDEMVASWSSRVLPDSAQVSRTRPLVAGRNPCRNYEQAGKDPL